MKTKQTKAKPIVKYRKSKYGIRSKLTLLATIKGKEAKAIADSQDAGEGLYWHYNDKKGGPILEIYEDKMLTPLD